MTQTATGGYGAYVNYGFEATYGAGATSARTFGRGVKISVARKNNMEKLFGLGARNASSTVALKYQGTASVDFVLCNGSFWRAVLGTVTDSTVGSVYTHTYKEANTIPSFAIDMGAELGGNDEVAELQGCKVASATLTAAVGETVKVKLECPYKTETLATSGIGSQQAESEAAFTFAQGTLELPSGSTIADVQNFELTINNDLEMLWGLGSRLATAGIEKKREYNIRMTVAFKDVTTLLTKFLGASDAPATGTPAAQATLVLTFTNGLATSDTGARSFVITLENVYIDEETLPKDVNEIIKEDVTGFALSGATNTVVYTNYTASDDDVP